MAMVSVLVTMAVLNAVTAKVPGAEGPVAGLQVFVQVIALVVRVHGVAAFGLGLPPVAAGEDVLYALVGGQLVGLATPRGGEGATVEVLEVGGIPRFRDAGYGCEA